jgi:glycosyltransferase involved in cell wall biosynthesis
MNILHTVEFYSPSVGGAQEVVKQISEQLVKQGHSVTVATTKLDTRTQSEINGVHIEEFNISGNAVFGFKGEIERYQQFLLNSKFDIMMNYAAQQWATDLVFPILGQIGFSKVMIPCGFSGLYNPLYSEYFENMVNILRSYDHLIFHAGAYRDIDFARNHGINHYSIIPNGASKEEFEQIDTTFKKRHRLPSDSPLLLTVGSHTGLKGHRLAIEAFRRSRINHAKLLIIGNIVGGGSCWRDCKRRAFYTNLFSFGNKKVLLHNPPRSDVVAAYHAADLFLFGSNVEYSPLVLFEAMASKTPFISTACGNAEEIAAWGDSGIILPKINLPQGLVDADPNEMAQAIEELISDPSKRFHMAQSGFQTWVERFTWENIALEYKRVYQSTILNNKNETQA